ncbi:TIGR02391 family protein [Methyloceanibacter sp.]|uniref:TIGR02391 family protein n=1 Tax=Methyloceanibacter sp. TaxID=1965321 RepID=UPI003D6D0E36
MHSKRSPRQIEASIAKLERRLKELEQARTEHWSDDKKRELDGLYTKVDETLTAVFGDNTPDRRRHYVTPFYRCVSRFNRKPADYAAGYHKGLGDAKSKIATAITVLKEQLGDEAESPEDQALRAYEGLELHPEIDRAASGLYRNEHYANAIEDAVKALNTLVRLRSGIEEDGTTLMQRAFSLKNPILKFNELIDESDRNEQLGYMMMFSGAVAGLRNPRAHKLIKDDPEQALEFIAFVSLLAKLLDGASKA